MTYATLIYSCLPRQWDSESSIKSWCVCVCVLGWGVTNKNAAFITLHKYGNIFTKHNKDKEKTMTHLG